MKAKAERSSWGSSLTTCTLRWEGERGSKSEEMRDVYSGEQYECTECRSSSPLSSRDVWHGPLCDSKPYRMTASRGSTTSKTCSAILAACVRTPWSNECIVLIKCLGIFRTCLVSNLSWLFNCSFVHAEPLLGSAFEGCVSIDSEYLGSLSSIVKEESLTRPLYCN